MVGMEQDDEAYALHGWLDLCTADYALDTRACTACRCGRLFTHQHGKPMPVQSMNSPGFAHTVRKNVPWRVFKRFCKIYNLNVNEYIDI